MFKKNNLFKKYITGAEITLLDFDKYNLYIEFKGKMNLTVYSKYEIIGSKKIDFSDLIGTKISEYKEEKDYYLIKTGKSILITISTKEEDYDPEIMKLVLSDGTIIVDRGE